jgi:uncharacterized GH25 family protein
MLKCLTLSLAVLAVLLGSAFAHDMFLVVEDHDVGAHQEVAVALYNGTFDKSENTIDRERMIDVSVVDAAGTVSHPLAEMWTDENTTSWLKVSTGPPGTLLVGVSTRPNRIDLTAEEFNEYLAHDGILDTLEARKQSGTDDEAASERYAKHVKTLLRVGGASSDTWKHRLGYPVELVPLSNPAELSPGDTLEALVLANGEPLADHLVYASYAGHHVHGDDGTHREAVKTRTDVDGIARIEISQSGRWYLRLIHMVPSDEEGVDYVSNWATLTFEVH